MMSLGVAHETDRILPEGTSVQIQDEIGMIAGVIWQTLSAKGELTLRKLKLEVQGTAPLFDWAIGWLAREDKIAFAGEKRSVRVRLKDFDASPVNS
jgi:hypothetical protein